MIIRRHKFVTPELPHGKQSRSMNLRGRVTCDHCHKYVAPASVCNRVPLMVSTPDMVHACIDCSAMLLLALPKCRIPNCSSSLDIR